MKNCNCDERWIERAGKRTRLLSEGTDWHSCSYIRERNALIPQAMDNLRERVGNVPRGRWTKLFSVEMDRLAREAKLI